MAKVLKKIKEKGFAHVRLSVLSSNLGGVRFYKKFDFEVYRYGMLKELF
jgi:ribosomal protein S18 acetylase RimI-like enzyme